MLEKSVSVVMPVFNEERSVEQAVRAVLAQANVRELIVVDDCSTDGTSAVLSHVSAGDDRVRILRHAVNRGKGSALQTAIPLALGELVIIQDADLEYDPADYPALMAPILAGEADVVFGSRFIDGTKLGEQRSWHAAGNWLFTAISNLTTGLKLTDMETCYKMGRRDVWQRLVLKENRFGVEPEITAKLARLGVRIVEVPVSYHGRTYAEGKKIKWTDGVHAVWCIFRYGWLR